MKETEFFSKFGFFIIGIRSIAIPTQQRGLLTGPVAFHDDLAHVLNQIDNVGKVIVKLDF